MPCFPRVMLTPALARRAVAVSLSAAPCRGPLIALPLTARHYHTSRPLLAASQPPETRGAATAASSPPPTAPVEATTQQQQEQHRQGGFAEAKFTALERSVKGESASPADSSSNSSPVDGRPAAQQSRGSTVADVMAGPESAMRRLFASWQHGVVASIGAVMGIGFLLYFLYTPVKEDTVHHTAVVASEALADARLKGQAVLLSKDVVLEVLRDPKSLDAAVDVVVQLLGREETKIAVSSLLQALFEDHYTQEVTKKFVLQVVQDPWIQDQLQGITEEQVRKLLRNPELKASLSDFLLRAAVDSLEKPQLHYEVACAIRHSAASVFNFWKH